MTSWQGRREKGESRVKSGLNLGTKNGECNPPLSSISLAEKKARLGRVFTTKLLDIKDNRVEVCHKVKNKATYLLFQEAQEHFVLPQSKYHFFGC